MPEALVGRQPIFTPDLEVHGYELLFRREGEDRACFTDADAATSQVILNAFHEIGIEEVVGRRQAFVNLTRGFIVGEYPLPLPVEGVVLEVLEHVEPDPEVLAGLGKLRERGYVLALDDYEPSDRTRTMLPFASIVKLDVDALDPAILAPTVRDLRKAGKRVVAEQVRTAIDFDHCLGLGFDYFQGFFLSRPNIVRGRRVSASRLSVLRLLSRLVDPACELEEIEQLIAQDVTLSYKLLRMINSVEYGMPRRIESVRETVVYLGRETVRNLAGLLVLSGLDDRPRELIVAAMVRARMCELLATAAGEEPRASFFATGMLSTLSALLECDMAEVVAELPLAAPIELALVQRDGSLGEALTCVLSYECGEWEEVAFKDLDPVAIKDAFLGAIQWAESVDRELSRAA